MRKTTLLVIIAILGSMLKSNAQANERIQSLKIAIFTEELNLSATEAQKFWPIYNEYDAKLSEMKEQQKIKNKSFRGKGEISEQDAEEILNAYLLYKQNQVELEKEYMIKLKTILAVKKIIRIPRAELRFKKALLAEIKSRQKH